MIEITEKVRNGEKIERIGRIVRAWKTYDDDDKNSSYDKNFAARCVIAEILRLVEEEK